MIVLRQPEVFRALPDATDDMQSSLKTVLGDLAQPRSLRMAAYHLLAAEATSPMVPAHPPSNSPGETLPRISTPDLLVAVRHIHRQTSAHSVERTGTQLRLGIKSKTVDVAAVWENILLSFGAQDVTYLQPEGQRHAVWAAALLLSSTTDCESAALRRLMRALPDTLSRAPASGTVVTSLSCLLVKLTIEHGYALEHLWSEVLRPVVKTIKQAMHLALSMLDLCQKLLRPCDLPLDCSDLDIMTTLAAIHLRSEAGAQDHLRLLRDLGEIELDCQDDSTASACRALRQDLACDQGVRVVLLKRHKLLEETLLPNGDTLLCLLLGVSPSESDLSNAIQQVLRYAPVAARRTSEVLALRMRVVMRTGGRIESAQNLYKCIAADGGLTMCAPELAASLVQQLDSRTLLDVSQGQRQMESLTC